MKTLKTTKIFNPSEENADIEGEWNLATITHFGISQNGPYDTYSFDQQTAKFWAQRIKLVHPFVRKIDGYLIQYVVVPKTNI